MKRKTNMTQKIQVPQCTCKYSIQMENFDPNCPYTTDQDTLQYLQIRAKIAEELAETAAWYHAQGIETNTLSDSEESEEGVQLAHDK